MKRGRRSILHLCPLFICFCHNKDDMMDLNDSPTVLDLIFLYHKIL